MVKGKEQPEKFYNQFLETVEKYIPDSYFEKHLAENKRFDLFENPQFVELFKHSPAIIGVFNNVTMGYEYLSDNLVSITGHPIEPYIGPNGMEYVLSTFVKEHAVIYTSHVFPTIFEYFQSHAQTEDIKKIRFTSSFQLVKKDGGLIWCMQQLNVIETDEQGFPLLTLLFMSDITHVKKDNTVDFIIARKDTNNVYQQEFVATYPTEGQVVCFTKRELEILQLLGKGKSSVAIASLLFISENTVNTHRQNMLSKANKKNTAELLSFAIQKGFVN